VNALVSLDHELARLLVQADRAQASGMLTVTRGKLRRIFCLDRGRLVFAASNVLEEQLGCRLVERAIVSLEALTRTQAESLARGAKLSALLVERHLVARQTLEREVADHVRELLFSTLGLSNGECAFSRGRPDLDGEVTADLPCVRLLLDYARQHPSSAEEVRVRIGPPGACPVATDGARELLEGHDDDGRLARLLEACTGSLPLAAIVERMPEPAEATWRTFYGLILAGVLELNLASQPTRTLSKAQAVTRDEVQARLQKSRGADHYAVLEISPAGSRDEIREAYYYLARRYHPDRFRAGPLEDLLGEIEAYFTQVTEAYNTLYDPESRVRYDDSRASEAGPGKPEVEQDTSYLAQQNYLRAKLLIERGRFSDAVTSLENAIKLDAKRGIYHLALGNLLSGNPRLRQQAAKHLLEATRLDPAKTEGYLALGELYLKMGRRADAAKFFREVLRWEPGHLEAEARLKELRGTEGDDDGGLLRGLFRG
jgi:curved DNA-binding protein CbpA